MLFLYQTILNETNVAGHHGNCCKLSTANKSKNSDTY